MTYQRRRTVEAKTQATHNAIGQRHKSRPDGQPGYVRVDTVHQGDQDGQSVRMILMKYQIISISYDIIYELLGLRLVPARKPHGQHFNYASRSSAPSIVQAK